MVDFSFKIINQIKMASDDSHVKVIVENSIRNLRMKNINRFGAKRRYMMNMIMALRYTKAEGLTTKAAINVERAIELFESLHKQEFSNLF
jgi:hypothetical protein